MKAIVYVSEARVSFDDVALSELAATSARNNTRLAVSGYLYYENGQFLQYIEGESQTVSTLMGRIELDPRHDVLATAHDGQLQTRRFPHWSMRQIRPSDVVRFRLENALADCLYSPGARTGNTTTWLQSVWLWADCIAAHQDQFASDPSTRDLP